MQAIKEVIQASLPKPPGQQARTIQSSSEAVSGPGEQGREYVAHCLRLLEEKGKVLYGPHFRLYSEDLPVLEKLLSYFSGDKEQAERLGLSLRKGILLTGPIGCGKTSLMVFPAGATAVPGQVLPGGGL
jgi:hypothetical protein